MENASFFQQTHVYFRKIRRIAFKERFWKFIVFAFIVSFLVAAVVGKDMFTTYESTKSGFFSIASASIWIGVFNSIQNICKEHEIIRAEYRSGMKISSYITATVLWQFILCLIQSVIILGVCYIFIDFNLDGVLMPAMIEYFITIFLMIFGADVMGLMISSIAGSPTTAMTIMPFTLILQLIMSGVLFELGKWSEKIAYLTFSKWGMSAIGSIADFNSDKFPLEISKAFPNVTRLKAEEAYEHTASNVITAWVCCLGLAFLFYLVSIAALKIKNRDS